MKKKINQKKFFWHTSAERGFNMFSAIVAIILILIGVVLTNTLITTEEKTNRQVYGMLNNYQLADVANLARADALQSFNYNFRERLEDYLTFDESELRGSPGFTLFVIKKDSTNFDEWSDVVSAFEQSILRVDFGEGQNFARAIRYVSEYTITGFDQAQYGKFNVSLTDDGPEAQDALYKAIMTVVSQEKENFLELIDCEGETSCNTGSFYFNIPLEKLTDEIYEALPRIIVKDQTTQEEVKMAILPRANLKVYIPLRFFKALFIARKAAMGVEQIHNELADYRLGFCAGCNPNTNPKSASSYAEWKKPCPSTALDSETPLAQVEGAPPAGVTTYFSGGGDAGRKGLQATAAKKICIAAASKGAFEQDPSDLTMKIKDEKLGPDSHQRETAIENCRFNDIIVSTGAEPAFRFQGINAGVGAYLRCGRIGATYSTIVIQENNKQYIVKGTYNGGKSNLYKIKIDDTGFEEIYSDQKIPGGTTSLPECKSERDSCKP